MRAEGPPPCDRVGWTRRGPRPACVYPSEEGSAGALAGHHVVDDEVVPGRVAGIFRTEVTVPVSVDVVDQVMRSAGVVRGGQDPPTVDGAAADGVTGPVRGTFGRDGVRASGANERGVQSPRIGTGTLGTTHNVGTIFGLHFVNLCVTQLRWRVAACLGVAGASLVSTTSCARQNPPHARLRFQSVLVEEYVSDLPVGTAIHLCLERMRCRTNTVSWAGRSNPPQIVSLPLPSGASSRAANGWTLRGYATSRGVRYRGSTRLIYHIAVDPPCKCAGDYAYLRLRPPRR